MPIAYQGSADLANNGGAGNLSVSYTVNANSNLLVVAFLGANTNGTEQTYTATYNGVALTNAVEWTGGNLIGPSNANRYQYLYYLINPATGSNTVLISQSGSGANSPYIIALAADYSGVLALDNTAQNGSASTTSQTTSVTTLTNNSWAMMLGQSFAHGPLVAGTGATRRTFGAAFGDLAFFDSNGPVTPAGSYSMTDTISPADCVINIMASFSPVICVPGSLALLGVGCGIWAAKKIEENPIIARRRLILPSPAMDMRRGIH